MARNNIAPTIDNTEAPSLPVTVLGHADEIHADIVTVAQKGNTIMLEHDGGSWVVRVMGKRADGGARLVLVHVD